MSNPIDMDGIEMLKLHYGTTLPPSEIAKIFYVPISTVKKYIIMSWQDSDLYSTIQDAIRYDKSKS